MIKCAYFIVALIAVQSLFHAAISRSRRGDNVDTVKLVGVVEPAMFMVKDNKFYGKNVEMIAALAKIAKFEPTYYETSTYGLQDDNGLWDGIVKELIDKKANMSAVALARTKHRLNYLHYTVNPETDGFTFLLKKIPGIEKVTTLAELINIPNMHFGMKVDGFVEKFFKDSIQGTAEANIWRKIKVRGGNRKFKTVASGIKQVKETDGRFAFVVAVDVGTFEVGKKPCNLMTIGHFAKVGAGVGLVGLLNDSFMARVDKAMAQITQNGLLEEIKMKWIQGPCHKENNDKSTTSGAVTSAAAIFRSIVLPFLLSAFY